MMTEFDLVRTNVDIMSEIMNENEPGKENQEDMQLLDVCTRAYASGCVCVCIMCACVCAVARCMYVCVCCIGSGIYVLYMIIYDVDIQFLLSMFHPIQFKTPLK